MLSKDPDLYHNAKMERHTETLRWRPMHAHQAKTWCGLLCFPLSSPAAKRDYALFFTHSPLCLPSHASASLTACRLPIWWIGTFAMNFLKPIQMLLSQTYNRSVRMMPLSARRVAIHVLGRILIFSLCHVWPFFVFSLGKVRHGGQEGLLTG
jgi:hypothetical protein